MKHSVSTPRLVALLVTLLLPTLVEAAADRSLEARRFVALLASGQTEAAFEMFDSTLRSALPAPKLLAVWNAVQAQAGEFQLQGATRVEQTGRYEIVYVTSRFAKAELDVKVVFDPTDRIAGLFFVPSRPAVLWRPPDYCSSDSFREIEGEVGAEGWRLPATLSLPAGNGPFPVVVLVHGSGPHDRDETIGPNRPFADLACGLASRGVAVLRYVKRTLQHASRLATSTAPFTVSDETVEDALAAAEAARSEEGVDPQRVYVLGHSLGGMLAPRIGQRDRRLAGLIVLAGAARPLEDVIAEQLAYVRSLQAESPEATRATEALAADVAKIRTLDPTARDSSELLFGAPASYWLDLRGYRPAEVARTLEQPMLVLQGERDYQVTMDDFRLWQEALGDRTQARLVSFPDLNHLFMIGQGKAVPAEYEEPGHVAPTVIDEIARWVSVAASGASGSN